MISDEGFDLLEGQGFILGNGQVLDILGLDPLLGTGEKVLKVAERKLDVGIVTY